MVTLRLRLSMGGVVITCSLVACMLMCGSDMDTVTYVATMKPQPFSPSRHRRSDFAGTAAINTRTITSRYARLAGGRRHCARAAV
ncbi:hypothetical protein EVAR_25610_1 [Eumeta japonica]|uniref:Secreted protein n=1 Tax=Eumeta variegata TaxID=151549 RepID=A0A4C1V275_EUMVA|nr:hypothetical protein EVAR_25610_1 [Eumeta japonica]